MTTHIRRTYEPFEPLRFLGRLMFVPLRVEKKTSLFSVTGTWEAEPPYRYATTRVVRLPLRWAVGIGWWRDTQVVDLASEEEFRRELEAANAAFDAYQAVNGPTDRDTWDSARRKIAEMGLDPDEEMELMQQFNVFGGHA